MLGPEIFLKLFLAIVFSGLIGLEREMRDRPAGLRTHLLVCVGSTIFMIVAQDLFVGSPDAVSRIMQGVITGIGFLGAGTIIISHSHIRGLTTAAGVWAVAGIGVVVGLGYYYLAAIAALVILAIIKLYKIEYHWHMKK